MTRLKTFAAALCLGLCLAAPAPAQENPMDDPRTREVVEAFQAALQQLQAKKYDEAIATYQDLLGKLHDYDWLPDEFRGEYQWLSHYNLSCAYSLKGETDPAIEHFRLAVDLGFDDLDHIAQDTDLDNIRDDERFRDIVAELKGADPHARAKKALVAGIAKDALFDFDFDLETVHGKKVSLADLRGQVVLVDVWGTWCPPCRKEIPHLIELYERHRASGFTIVGLNWERVPADKAADHVKTFLAKNGVEYPCALAPEALIKSIPDFEGFPTMLFVDKQGRVRLKKVGYTEGAVLEAAITALLAEEGPSGATDEEPADKPAEKKPAEKKDGTLF